MSIQAIYNAVLEFDRSQVMELVQAEIDNGTEISTILDDGLIAAMDEVGLRFSEGDLFVPEMLQAAQAMSAGMELVKPFLAEGASQSRGTVVIGTVKGDLHDIGKNLVAMMLEGAGFKVVDMGVDVEASAFLKKVQEENAQVVALSALLTTTMPAMEETTRLFQEAGSNAKIMVGGAPVTNDFANKIKADGYAQDAPSAVELARKLASA